MTTFVQSILKTLGLRFGKNFVWSFVRLRFEASECFSVSKLTLQRSLSEIGRTASVPSYLLIFDVLSVNRKVSKLRTLLEF